MAALPQQVQQFGVGIRHNVPADRRCPRCFRPGTLTVDDSNSAPSQCTGCGCLFWYEAAFGFNPAALVETSPPEKVEPVAPPMRECTSCGKKHMGWSSRCDLCRPMWQSEQRGNRADHPGRRR